ncbi:hypothetical protein [Phenylobacterium sp.]|uniref:hypothetical protein n=1 Tax=Phenylobacterium sp. TaxID=1871053 RepID=UPI00271B889C|nr:hypothetical protein [Phenylobacterium sp.]MDO8801771.1 hypothetical protein [Phenylobacterium sp.]
MKNKQLLEKASRLGYPLLESKESFDVNEALAELVKAKNVRFLEGFPVMLANAAKEDGFDYVRVEALLKSKTDKEVLKGLSLLSLALYKANGLYLDWTRAFESKLTTKQKEQVKFFREALSHGAQVKAGSYRLNSDRLQNMFQNYFTLKDQEARGMSAKHEEMSLEFALSQVFSSKQKDLFRKKLKGEPLTKTEREYFSRAVKKKTAALANPELHRLAQKVLQN